MTRLVVFSPIRLFGEALVACMEIRKQISKVVYCHVLNRLSEEVVAFEPNVVLFDINGENAMQEAQTLNAAIPEISLLAIAISETPEQVIACADAGFSGYVPHRASIEELCKIVEMAKKGECICHPRIAGYLLRELGHRRQLNSYSAIRDPLTRRECEVLRLLGRGHSNKEIARELCLSVATVKNHVHSVLIKLNVGCRTEAVSRLREDPRLAHSA